VVSTLSRYSCRLSAWMVLSAWLLVAASGSAEVSIRVNPSEVVGRCDSFLWANIGFDPLYAEITAPEAQPVLRMIRESAAFRYIRCHNYFSDGMSSGRRGYFGCRVYSEDDQGRPHYNWWFLDEVLDHILAAGMRPIVEGDFMPDALADGPPLRNYGGGLVNTPKDYQKYRDLVFAMVKHCEDRYGPEEVRQWRWEVWNEPDLYRYFIDGRGPGRKWTPASVQRFNRMYDYFVDGATAVDPEVQVGGPGIAGNIEFLRAFLNHCVNGTNAVTGKKGTRIDFISWHGYGRTPSLLRKNQRFKELISKEFPSLADREVQQNEWGQPLRIMGRPNRSPSCYHEFEAALLCRYLDTQWSDPGSGVNLFLRWGRLVSLPEGGWRTLTKVIHGETLPAPVFHAYVLLGKLGPERLEVDQPDFPAPIRALATRTEDGAVQVLVYRFDEGNEEGRGTPKTVSLTIAPMPQPVRSCRIYRIDRDHSNFFRAWQKMGTPRQFTPTQVTRLSTAARLHEETATAVSSADGTVRISLELPVNSVVLVALNGEYRRKMTSPPVIQRVLRGEEALQQARASAKNGNADEAVRRWEKIAADYGDLYIGQEALRDLIAHYVQAGNAQAADKARTRLLEITIGDDEALKLWRERREYALARGDAALRQTCDREIVRLEARVKPRGPWAP